jgi:hypothetical protein
MLQAMIDEWPNISPEIMWGLVAIPATTVVACCLWLRVLWPSPPQQDGGETPHEKIKAGNVSER